MSSSLRSAPRVDRRDELRHRFVEAARRAQIVTIVNRAETEAELGELVTAELCEVFEAEIAFVVALSDNERPGLVGTYGLRYAEAARLLDNGPPRSDVRRRGVTTASTCSSIGARHSCAPLRRKACARRCRRGPALRPELRRGRGGAARGGRLERRARARAPSSGRRARPPLSRGVERAQAARVIGSIADGVLLVDAAGIVQLWNPAAEAITGLARDVVIGRPLEEAIPGWSAIAGCRRHEPRLVDRSGGSVPDRRRRARALALDQGRRLRRGHRLRVPRPDRGAAARAAKGRLHRHGVARAAYAARRCSRRGENAAARGRPPRRRGRPTAAPLISEQSERLAAMVNDILLASRVDSPELRVATEQRGRRRGRRRGDRGGPGACGRSA